MYTIYWLGLQSSPVLVGDSNSIFAVAMLLEDARIAFKVADARGFLVDQRQMGWGGFTCWLDRFAIMTVERVPRDVSTAKREG